MATVEKITVTPAMVSVFERATACAHGIEVGGHPATVRAMASRGLIKANATGGTLTLRGMWLRGYLAADGVRRSFAPAELDSVCGHCCGTGGSHHVQCPKF